MELKEAIISLENRIGKMIPVEELEKELQGKMEKTVFDDALDKLSMSGDIFKPKKGYIQRVN